MINLGKTTALTYRALAGALTSLTGAAWTLDDVPGHRPRQARISSPWFGVEERARAVMYPRFSSWQVGLDIEISAPGVSILVGCPTVLIPDQGAPPRRLRSHPTATAGYLLRELRAAVAADVDAAQRDDLGRHVAIVRPLLAFLTEVQRPPST